jgi:hypothetical protein
MSQEDFKFNNRERFTEGFSYRNSYNQTITKHNDGHISPHTSCIF